MFSRIWKGSGPQIKFVHRNDLWRYLMVGYSIREDDLKKAYAVVVWKGNGDAPAPVRN